VVGLPGHQRLLAELAQVGEPELITPAAHAPMTRPAASPLHDRHHSLSVSIRCQLVASSTTSPFPATPATPTPPASTPGGSAELQRSWGDPARTTRFLYVHIPFCRHACWYCAATAITSQAGAKVVGPYLGRLLARETASSSGQCSARRRRLPAALGGAHARHTVSLPKTGPALALIAAALRPGPRPGGLDRGEPEFPQPDECGLRRAGVQAASASHPGGRSPRCKRP